MKKNSIWLFMIITDFIMKGFPKVFISPQPTGKIADDFYTIRDRDVNLYLFKSNDNAVLIDAGYPNNTYLRDDFERIGVDPEEVTHIFLTHSDMDHAGSVDDDYRHNLFKNAHVYMGQGEEALAKTSVTRRFGMYSPVTITNNYNTLKDGDEIRIGGISVKAISASGHTPGHSAYLINDKILCCGDAMNIRGDRIIFPVRLYCWDARCARDSIIKLSRLENISHLCTGHTGCTTTVKEAFKGWNKDNIYKHR